MVRFNMDAPDLGKYPVPFRYWQQAIKVANIWAASTNLVHKISKEGPYWCIYLTNRRIDCHECRQDRGLPNAR